MSFGNFLYTESDKFGESYRSSRYWLGTNDPAHKAENSYTANIHRQQRSWVARVNIKTVLMRDIRTGHITRLGQNPNSTLILSCSCSQRWPMKFVATPLTSAFLLPSSRSL